MRKLVIVSALLLFAGTAFGQSLKSGVILGLHEVTVILNPDVTMNQYLDFMNTKVKPEFEKNLPGVKLFILKGTRGKNEHGVGFLFWMESEEMRDKLWPKEGESSETVTQAFEKMSETMEKWRAMEVSYSSEHTDWAIQ